MNRTKKEGSSKEKEKSYTIPAILWMGIFTYSMVSLPGTPQIQNIIPAAVFGTTTWV